MFNSNESSLTNTIEVNTFLADIPRFVAGNRRNQYGIPGEQVKINVKIRSFPEISDVKITAEDGKTKPVSIESNIQISDVWHGVKLNLSGFVVSSTFQYVEYSDFQNYTFLVTNGEGSSYFTVQLQSAGMIFPNNMIHLCLFLKKNYHQQSM